MLRCKKDGGELTRVKITKLTFRYMDTEIEDVADLELDDHDHHETLEIVFENKTKISLNYDGRIEIEAIQKKRMIKEN